MNRIALEEPLANLTIAEDEHLPGVCPLCAGRGWVVSPDGGAGAARRCSCYTNRPIETKLREAGVGADLLHASWNTWQGLRPDLSTFPNPDCCVTFSGSAGNGKSHAAVAILREWLLRGYKGRFIEIPDFLEELKSRFGTDEHPEVIIRELAVYDIVALDEAYAQQATPWADATLSRIIRGRLREQRPTVITTNLSAGQLLEVEPRVASRLYGNLFIPFTGRDRRTRPGGTK